MPELWLSGHRSRHFGTFEYSRAITGTRLTRLGCRSPLTRGPNSNKLPGVSHIGSAFGEGDKLSKALRMMKAAASGLAFLLIFSFFGTSVLRAQAVSQISGTVKDSTGAIVAGAQVTATQTETDFKRTRYQRRRRRITS